MSSYIAVSKDETYIAHHGILGQKWGIRRFQNPDGTYTSAGKARYGIGDGVKKKSTTNDTNSSNENSMTTAKKIAIGTSIAAAVGLTAYGSYKYNKIIKSEADRLTIAKGKAIYDHVLSTMSVNPNLPGSFGYQASQASSQSSGFVSHQTLANKKLSNARRMIKDFKKEVATGSDLGKRMEFYDTKSKVIQKAEKTRNLAEDIKRRYSR